MLVTLSAILPVFSLILFGWLIRRIQLLDDSAWPSVERLTYFVLFPCLLVVTLAEAPFREMAIGAVAAALALAILTVSAVLLAVRPWLTVSGPGFTSVYQGSIRMNSYIGLSIAASLYGTPGLAAAALAIAIIVPLVNLGCVLMLSHYGACAAPMSRIWAICLKNPLILGALAGLGLNLTGWGLPVLLGSMAQILSKAALPMGLLAVGAALNLAALPSAGKIVAATSTIKLVALPLLTAALLRLMSVDGVEASVAILFSALPTATSAYVLASQFGGDARLMAVLTTAETLLSMLTLPILLALLG